MLTGAAEAVRQLTGVGEQASIVTYEPFVASVLRRMPRRCSRPARARGRAMTVREATEPFEPSPDARTARIPRAD